MSKDGADKLSKIQKKMEQLKAQMVAEKNRLDERNKKDDLRRKILVGAYYLEQAQKDGSMEKLAKTIEPVLTRDNDRALFGLPALNAGETKN